MFDSIKKKKLFASIELCWRLMILKPQGSTLNLHTKDKFMITTVKVKLLS